MKNLLHRNDIFVYSAQQMFENPTVNLNTYCNSRAKIACFSFSVDLHFSLCRLQYPKCKRVIRLVYPHFFCKLRSSSSSTNKNLTKSERQIRIALSRLPFRIKHMYTLNYFSHNGRHYHFLKYWPFLLESLCVCACSDVAFYEDLK
jgi:hypothetical protein